MYSDLMHRILISDVTVSDVIVKDVTHIAHFPTTAHKAYYSLSADNLAPRKLC